MSFQKVYIVIVNYNGWEDTIECLESVFKMDYENYQVVVVDNDSTNDSLAKLKKWTQGDLIIKSTKNKKLKLLSFPFKKKPIPYLFYTKKELLLGGENKEKTQNYPIIFVEAGKNNGFAGGNNIGIKYAQAKNDFSYVWLLNNDTIIEKNTLTNLVKGIRKYDNVVAVGSKILYYNEPELIQSLGSKIDSKSIYKLNKPIINTAKRNIDKNEDVCDIEVNDIMGASLLVNKEVINKVGLIPEEYFLYGEETDWNFNFQQNGYKLMTITSSRVYHKENRSTGKSDNPIMLYYKTRNQFILYKKYKNIFIFNTRLYFFQYVIRKFFTALFSSVKVRKAILKGLVHGFKQVKGKQVI